MVGIEDIVDDFIAACMTDVGIIPESERKEIKKEMVEAIEHDLDELGDDSIKEWDVDAIYLMVMGDDTGEIPAELMSRWPHLNAVLNDHFS